jgi:hypothetical protein
MVAKYEQLLVRTKKEQKLGSPVQSRVKVGEQSPKKNLLLSNNVQRMRSYE